MKHAVVIGIVAGMTAALVLVLLWLVTFFLVGGSRSHHVVELDRKGQPTYTVP
jgi:amino acid permease